MAPVLLARMERSFWRTPISAGRADMDATGLLHRVSGQGLRGSRRNGCADHATTADQTRTRHVGVSPASIESSRAAVDAPSESHHGYRHRREPMQPVRARWKHGGNAIAPAGPGFSIFQDERAVA